MKILNKYDMMVKAIREAFPNAKDIEILITTDREGDREFDKYVNECYKEQLDNTPEEKIGYEKPRICLKFNFV